MTYIKKAALFFIAWLIVTFGVPAYYKPLGILAASIGWAIPFVLISEESSWKKRFLIGSLFFFSFQLVQLYWFTSHPYSYIWGVYLLASFLTALQFGILSLIITKKNLTRFPNFLAIAALWTLLEWTRDFWLSGFSFNPLGLSLSCTTSSLQVASYCGILGMSFWVMLTNTLVAASWLLWTHATHELSKTSYKILITLLAIIAIILPYGVGTFLLKKRIQEQAEYDIKHTPLVTLIVHSAMLPDELQKRLNKSQNPIEDAFDSWKRLIGAVAPYKGEKFDLVILPEISVPYANSIPLFNQYDVQKLFWDTLRESNIENENPSYQESSSYGNGNFSSAAIAQALANCLHAPIIVGLEGVDYAQNSNKASYYNSAFFFRPQAFDLSIAPSRYDKQILVPMGEYIPFNWAKSIASEYGITDSFTPGNGPVIFELGAHKIAPSVCYEEIFSNLMRQNSLKGATLFVNVTDDYWYPNSSLAIQHFEHARPRTVENGVPLIRSCNFGVSGALDSLGRNISIAKESENPSALMVKVSTYHYPTFYAVNGNVPLLVLCMVILVIFCFQIPSRNKFM